MMKNYPRFQEALEYHLHVKLQSFLHMKVDRALLDKIQKTIYDTIDAVFSKSSKNISETTKKWISQKYYESITISDSPILSQDNQKIHLEPANGRIDIKNIPTGDLQYIEQIFNESNFHNDIIQEIRRR